MRSIFNIFRHKPKDLPKFPMCNHAKNVYCCKNLRMCDIKQFHANLYSTTDKVKQDIFVLKFCEGQKPKRSSTNLHGISIKYFVPTVTGVNIRVCKKAFLGITHLSAERIERIVRKFIIDGEMPKERRGGDKIKDKFEPIKSSIKVFIESLECAESHYSRGRSTRLYLPCDLNFVKLYKMFCQQNQQHPVKLSYFRTYVNQNYNLSFGTVLTDACSTCLRAKELVKKANSEKEKLKVITEQRIHTLRSKAFYSLLKNGSNNVQILSFDCQKNLSLPKLPDQAAYFTQQINYHNFTIVAGNSKSQLSPVNVTSYVWLEYEHQKNSNAIASAVYDTLTKFKFEEHIEKVDLFADGCGGQNKNSTVMAMITYWLGHEAPEKIKTVEIIFPVVGHSFLPSDRIFGLIEREIRKKDTILDRKQYEEIIRKYSKVLILGEDWQICDWKTKSDVIVKKPAQWHFRCNQSKRFIFLKEQNGSITVRGEIFYRSDTGFGKSILKKGKKIALLKPDLQIIGNSLRGNKSSIDTLLKKHFGRDWRNDPDLQFYKIIDINSEPLQNMNNNTDDNIDDEDPEELRI